MLYFIFKNPHNNKLDNNRINNIKKDIELFLEINHNPSQNDIDHFCRHRDYWFEIVNDKIIVYIVK